MLWSATHQTDRGNTSSLHAGEHPPKTSVVTERARSRRSGQRVVQLGESAGLARRTAASE
eukprot:6202724-Pleurochrysis_carterae.AAC.6